jgi:hypothetical protein
MVGGGWWMLDVGGAGGRKVEEVEMSQEVGYGSIFGALERFSLLPFQIENVVQTKYKH